MDQERFDQLTRTLASGVSRRRMMRGITGTALGGLLASVGIADAGAKPKTKEKTKEKCTAPNTTCGNGNCCTSSEVCSNGECLVAPNPGPVCIPGAQCFPIDGPIPCGCNGDGSTTCCAETQFDDGVCCPVDEAGQASCCFLVTADGATPVGCCPAGTDCDQTVGLCRTR